MKNLLIAFAALLLVSSVTLLLISSCKKKDDPVAVDGVTVSPATASVAAGATVPLKTTVTPENAADKSLTWNSSDNNIATVAEGVVTGRSAGTAVITAASHSNPDKSARCTVTVTVAVEGVALLAEGGGGGGVSVATGATLQLTVAVTPENATDKSLTWTSSDDNLATVSADGIVTGKSPGTVTIIVASKSNPDKSARCTVTVTAAAVEGVAISPPETSVKVNLTVKLTAIVMPQNVADKSVTWTSGDARIAIVSADGIVTGKLPGTVTITAVSNSNPGKLARCPVTVTSDIVPLTALGVNPSSVSMLANGTQRLVAIFTPESASDKSVTWTSSNETVAAVASDGLVTAKAIAGTATITVKSTNRQTIVATCLVTVTTTSVAVTGISVEPVTLSLEEGVERQLRADVAPPEATNQNVTYQSSASSVASVSETGLVRALGAGTAVITVTSVSDATKTAGCAVTVTAAPVAVASISVEPVTLTLTTGAERQLRAVVTPENATNQNVAYVSSASSVASVSGTGLVRALGAGTAVITVTSVSDATKTAACAVTVTAAPVAVASISVDPVTLTLATGAARQLRAVVTPENATNQNVTYVSSVPSVASVSGTGLVRALAVGTTVITVTSVSDATKTATCAVTVLSNDASVSAIALGDENFPLTVPSAGGTTALNNAPRTFASAITAVKVNITAAANATIKIGNEAFISGGTANFSAPVAFTVTAQDGVTVRTYTAAITAYDAASNPYGIYTAAHLNDVRNNKAGSYKMMNNIVLPARNAAGAVVAGISDYADKGWLPIAHDAEAGGGGAFTGKFDGGNFFVDNFYINRNAAGDNYTGLFGRTSGAVISNVGITGSASPAVKGRMYAGALAGYIQGGSVTNCYAHVSVRCESNNANVTVCAGGLIGYMIGGASLSASYSSGDVSGALPGNGAFLFIGGLAGSVQDAASSIRNCFAAGNIDANAKLLIYGGGLVGVLDVSVANCYAAGNVACTTAQANATIGVGALFGIGGTSIIPSANCYRNSGAAITANGQPATPSDASVSGITSKTKAQMQDDVFKNLLNNGGSAWGRDSGKNDGLPYIIGVGVGK